MTSSWRGHGRPQLPPGVAEGQNAHVSGDGSRDPIGSVRSLSPTPSRRIANGRPVGAPPIAALSPNTELAAASPSSGGTPLQRPSASATGSAHDFDVLAQVWLPERNDDGSVVLRTKVRSSSMHGAVGHRSFSASSSAVPSRVSPAWPFTAVAALKMAMPCVCDADAVPADRVASSAVQCLAPLRLLHFARQHEVLQWLRISLRGRCGES